MTFTYVNTRQLRVNRINLGTIMATSEEPTGERRDIGEEGLATDGSMRVTRLTRKRDLKFKTIPLSAADAFAWESLLIGEGEVWSFDASLYGSKGLGPFASAGATVVGTGAPKFGAKMLNLAATSGTISYMAAINTFGVVSTGWTVIVYRSTDAGTTWTHYVVRSDGAKWVDRVRNDAASTTWLTVGMDGKVTIANVTGAAVNYDDLTILPFDVLASWIPALGWIAFCPLPYLDLDGSFIPEQTRRRVLGHVTDTILKAAGSSKLRLDVDFKAK